MIHRKAREKKPKKRMLANEKKTIYPRNSNVHFRLIRRAVSLHLFRSTSLPPPHSSSLFLVFHPESPALLQFSPHFCVDRTMSRHQGSIALRDIWRVPERPVFPATRDPSGLLVGMFLVADRADTSPSCAERVYDLTLLREIFSSASSVYFPPLARRNRVVSLCILT